MEHTMASGTEVLRKWMDPTKWEAYMDGEPVERKRLDDGAWEQWLEGVMDVKFEEEAHTGILRKRLIRPTWNEVFERTAWKMAHKNAWRMTPDIGPEDLVQESFLIFHKILDKYPQAVDTKHVMSLFMTSFWRYMHDLSKLRWRRKETHAEPVIMEGVAHDPFDLIADDDDAFAPVEFQIFFDGCPPRLRRVMKILLDADELPPYKKVYPPGGGGLPKRETTEQYLRRLSGITRWKSTLRADIAELLEVE